MHLAKNTNMLCGVFVCVRIVYMFRVVTKHFALRCKWKKFAVEGFVRVRPVLGVANYGNEWCVCVMSRFVCAVCGMGHGELNSWCANSTDCDSRITKFEKTN